MPGALSKAPGPNASRQDSALDTGLMLREDRSVTGRAEGAVRGSVSPGDLLATPTGRREFTVARCTTVLGARPSQERTVSSTWNALPKRQRMLHASFECHYPG